MVLHGQPPQFTAMKSSPPSEPPKPLDASEVDEVLAKMELALSKVDKSQDSAVQLHPAELDLLKQLERARDLMTTAVQTSHRNRQTLSDVFGGDGARIARIRAVLEAAAPVVVDGSPVACSNRNRVVSFGRRASCRSVDADGRRWTSCIRSLESLESVMGDATKGSEARARSLNLEKRRTMDMRWMDGCGSREPSNDAGPRMRHARSMPPKGQSRTMMDLGSSISSATGAPGRRPSHPRTSHELLLSVLTSTGRKGEANSSSSAYSGSPREICRTLSDIRERGDSELMEDATTSVAIPSTSNRSRVVSFNARTSYADIRRDDTRDLEEMCNEQDSKTDASLESRAAEDIRAEYFRGSFSGAPLKIKSLSHITSLEAEPAPVFGRQVSEEFDISSARGQNSLTAHDVDENCDASPTPKMKINSILNLGESKLADGSVKTVIEEFDVSTARGQTAPTARDMAEDEPMREPSTLQTPRPLGDVLTPRLPQGSEQRLYWAIFQQLCCARTCSRM